MPAERDGQWVARAEHDDGQRVGIDCAGVAGADAVDRLTRCFEPQLRPTATFASLQDAARDYHRTVNRRFANPVVTRLASEAEKTDPEAMDAARRSLADIRSRKPEPRV